MTSCCLKYLDAFVGGKGGVSGGEVHAFCRSGESTGHEPAVFLVHQHEVQVVLHRKFIVYVAVRRREVEVSHEEPDGDTFA